MMGQVVVMNPRESAGADVPGAVHMIVAAQGREATRASVALKLIEVEAQIAAIEAVRDELTAINQELRK